MSDALMADATNSHEYATASGQTHVSSAHGPSAELPNDQGYRANGPPQGFLATRVDNSANPGATYPFGVGFAPNDPRRNFAFTPASSSSTLPPLVPPPTVDSVADAILANVQPAISNDPAAAEQLLVVILQRTMMCMSNDSVQRILAAAALASAPAPLTVAATTPSDPSPPTTEGEELPDLLPPFSLLPGAISSFVTKCHDSETYGADAMINYEEAVPRINQQIQYATSKGIILAPGKSYETLNKNLNMGPVNRVEGSLKALMKDIQTQIASSVNSVLKTMREEAFNQKLETNRKNKKRRS